MRAGHINCFIASVKNVFTTMLETDVTVSKPRLGTDGKSIHDVRGIIALSGDVAGSVILSFPSRTAARAVEAFAGMRFEQDTDEFSDAIGELANMVAGNAKKDFDGLDIHISVPTVIIGQGHQLGRNPLGPWIILECNSRLGMFELEVCVLEVAAVQAKGGTHASSCR